MKQVKEYRINNSTIKIGFGNILESQADVIANSSGSRITMRGGLTKAIREAGGEEIRQDAQAKLPVKLGDAVVTTAGKLRQKYIFHCITLDTTLDHSGTPEGIPEEEIQQYIIGHSLDKCFQLMHVMELSSIALPAIGAGAARIPFEKVAQVMSETVAKNLRKTNKNILVEIYLFDRFHEMERWDFLPMFERFSSQEALANLLKEQAHDLLLADETFFKQGEEVAPPDQDKDIFISYSRKDSEIVKAIYGWLENAGYKCWLDIDGMYSGISYKQVIVDAIKRSKVLLFMSSENSNKSRNVVSEIAVAIEYGKSVIPVRLDMTHYNDGIQYDIGTYDYVEYDRSRMEESNREMLKKIVSTMGMI